GPPASSPAVAQASRACALGGSGGAGRRHDSRRGRRRSASVGELSAVCLVEGFEDDPAAITDDLLEAPAAIAQKGDDRIGLARIHATRAVAHAARGEAAVELIAAARDALRAEGAVYDELTFLQKLSTPFFDHARHEDNEENLEEVIRLRRTSQATSKAGCGAKAA
ncbi:MAG TPA: hypothetical protein VEO54_07630, partial [Thermoanaerobaculia bacterium]|nr:hypothetical protein [Thermoanaerobaculia bacterium]